MDNSVPRSSAALRKPASKRLAAEAKQALADRDWWKAFGDLFGWRLCGFSYRDTASFDYEPHERWSYTRIEIVAKVKADIEAAIASEQRATARNPTSQAQDRRTGE